MAVAFVGVLCSTGWHFIKRRWKKGLTSLLMILVCGFAAIGAMLFLTGSTMFGPSEDGFAYNFTIPDNLEIAEPLHELNTEPVKKDDGFQIALLLALETPGNNDSTITANIPSLISLQTNAPEILKRYLATSPSWRVFKEHGKVFATRRWMVGSQWRYTLHGYYSAHSIDSWPDADISNFQSRFTLGFSGEPWARVSDETTRMKVGQTKPLTLTIGNQMHESWCLITAENLVIEVFEQSDAEERRLTKAALSYVEQELTPFVIQPTWSTIRENLPTGSISHGNPSFDLWVSYQPGIYDSSIWVNPGESGMLYLKAFEVMTETPLSVDRLKERTNEWIGWSDNSGDLFLSNTHFTIYEGDWGQPYAARFEVWFTPDSGSADRKLMEKVFKIVGWQR